MLISPGAEILLQQQAQLRVLLPQDGCFSEELGPVLKDLAEHGGQRVGVGQEVPALLWFSLAMPPACPTPLALPSTH